MARQENPRIVAGNLNISQKFEIQAHRHAPSTRAIPSSSSVPPPLSENPKSQAQTKKNPNPLAAMHVLVNPLEIVPGRGGPPALRSRVPSTSRHCVLSRSSGLRALQRKFRRKVLMETVQAHRHAVSREELVKALLFEKKAGQDLVKASSMACRERLGVQSQ